MKTDQATNFRDDGHLLSVTVFLGRSPDLRRSAAGVNLAHSNLNRYDFRNFIGDPSKSKQDSVPLTSVVYTLLPYSQSLASTISHTRYIPGHLYHAPILKAHLIFSQRMQSHVCPPHLITAIALLFPRYIYTELTSLSISHRARIIYAGNGRHMEPGTAYTCSLRIRPYACRVIEKLWQESRLSREDRNFRRITETPGTLAEGLED